MRSSRVPKTVTRLKRRSDGTQLVVMTGRTAPWQLGQRVWFQVGPGRIEVTSQPQGRRVDRRHNSRIRRGFKSLLREG
jgi:hypothetical protein